eukprot:UN29122
MAQCQFTVFRKQRALLDPDYQDMAVVDYDAYEKDTRESSPDIEENGVASYIWGDNNYRIIIPARLLMNRNKRR